MMGGSFRFGDWRVWPRSNRIERDGATRQMEPRLMQVLCALCGHAGQVLSTDDLLRLCWGTTVYGDGPVHKAIAQLRRALGDRAGQARYIETIRKRGYRTVAAVAPLAGRPFASGGEAAWSNGSPFRGLEPFEPRHAAVFFGRAQAESELLACMRAQQARGCALTVLLGPSGSGKTSLVRAGILPALRSDDTATACTTTFDLARLERDGPWRLLAESMLDWRIGGRPALPAQPAATLARRLRESPLAVLADLRWQLDGMAQVRSGATPGPTPGLFVDQWEKLLLASTDGVLANGFAGTLQALATSGEVQVIVACRNDFYPQLARVPALMSVKAHGGHYDLAAPSPAEIAQMIRLPARAAGLSFGTDAHTRTQLDDALCADAMASTDALPLLQYALHLLYEARSPLGELEFSAYRRFGGIEGALSYRADILLAGLGEREQACVDGVLARLVHLPEGSGAVVGRRVPWSALASDAERTLVRALVDARLLVSELVAGVPGFGVAHEALLRRWPRATAWIDQHRATLRIHGRVAAQARRWLEAGRASDLLLPAGRQLEEARSLLEGRMPLAQLERELIEASGRRATRTKRFRGAALASIFILAMLSVVLALAATRADRIAQARRAQAEGLMGYMLGDLADKLRPLGRLDLLEGISDQAFAYLADLRHGPGDATDQLQRAQALQVIAEVRIARGNPERAIAALEASRRPLLHRLSEAPDDVAALKLLGANAFWLGKVRLDRNEWMRAERHFNEYLSASRRWRRLRPDDTEALVEESYALNSLGSLWLKRGEVQRAADAFIRSVDLKRRAMRQRPGDAVLRAELADSLSWAGTAQQRDGRLQDALATYRQAASMIATLQDDPSAAVWRHRQAYALMHGAELHQALGEADRAVAGFRGAAARLEQLVAQQPDNLAWQRDWLYAQLQVESLLPGQPPRRSVATLDSLLDRARLLTTHDPDNAQWLRLQASTGTLLAQALARAGQHERARERILRSLSALQVAYADEPDNVATREALANAWLAAARIIPDDGIDQGACNEAAELLRPSAGDSRDYRILVPWMHSQACVGQRAAAATARQTLDSIGYRGGHRDDWTGHPASKGVQPHEQAAAIRNANP